MTSSFSKKSEPDTHHPDNIALVESTTDEYLYCINCDYNLSGSNSLRCPSCGIEIDRETILATTSVAAARRICFAMPSLIIASATTIIAWILLSRGKRLSVFDAIVILAVALTVAGHITLFVQVIRSTKYWPQRWDEVATILVFLAGTSMLAGMVGATQALNFEPSTLYNAVGVKVNGFFEFALLAGLIGMPAASLLIITLIAYRTRPINRGKGQITPDDNAQLSRPENAPLKIIVSAQLADSKVSQSWNPEPRTTNAAIERLISQTWEAELALAQIQNRMLYDGQLARLQRVEFDTDSNSLHLVLGSTCYRDFFCTNLCNSHLANTYSQDHLSNAIGVSVLPVTTDSYIALGVRSDRVAYHVGRVHPFGGMVEALDRLPSGDHDLFGSAKRELIEELGIETGQVQSLKLLGLIEDTHIKQPELVFEATLTLSKADLEIRLAAESGKDEHEAFHLSKAKQDAVAALLSSDLNLTPVAMGTLLLFGQHRWGQTWYDKCSSVPIRQ